MVRLKTRWSDWESDGPGPFTFRKVLGTLIEGLYLKGLIDGYPDKKAFDSLMQECYSALTEPEEWWEEIPFELHGGRTPQRVELDRRIHLAFHHLWTMAGSTHYVKAEWMQFAELLRELGWRG